MGSRNLVNYITSPLQNQDKINYVIDGLLAFLPKILRCFITRENVKAFAQGVFDDVKEALDYRG